MNKIIIDKSNNYNIIIIIVIIITITTNYKQLQYI